MKQSKKGFDSRLVKLLQSGGVAVIRTDTIYGIVARADLQPAVERVYRIKGRAPNKSPIVLISDSREMFDKYSQAELAGAASLWPGKNSVILPSAKAPEWIERGNRSVAYRIPAEDKLRWLIAHTGPLIAPSANPESLPPAQDIAEAQAYFGDLVDVYIDGGRVEDDSPSQLFRLSGGGLEQLR